LIEQHAGSPTVTDITQLYDRNYVDDIYFSIRKTQHVTADEFAARKSGLDVA